MDSYKQKTLGDSVISFQLGYEYLLEHPCFQSALETVKSTKHVSVPFTLENNNSDVFLLRKTRRNHFDYLHDAFSSGVPVTRPVLNISESDGKHFLVVSHPQVKPLLEFLFSNASNQRKLLVLKKIGLELRELNWKKMRHGDVVHANFFVGKGDAVLIANPEMDHEFLGHLQSDLKQFREMLFHLEREMVHDPPGLWEAVRRDSVIQKLCK